MSDLEALKEAVHGVGGGIIRERGIRVGALALESMLLLALHVVLTRTLGQTLMLALNKWLQSLLLQCMGLAVPDERLKTLLSGLPQLTAQRTTDLTCTKGERERREREKGEA